MGGFRGWCIDRYDDNKIEGVERIIELAVLFPMRILKCIFCRLGFCALARINLRALALHDG
jgi:hypothetical protein